MKPTNERIIPEWLYQNAKIQGPKGEACRVEYLVYGAEDHPKGKRALRAALVCRLSGRKYDVDIDLILTFWKPETEMFSIPLPI